MRIGLIVPGFSASEDDWCIPALLNSVEILTQDHDVHVFTLRYPHHTEPYQVYGATVHPLNGQQRRGWTRLRLVGQCLQAIQRENRQQPFDILHGLWAEEPGLIAVLAGWRHNIPAVVSVMGGELVGLPEIGYGYQLSRFMRWLIDYTLKSADSITVGSDLLAGRVPSIYQTKTHRIPLGVDTRLFKASSPPFSKLPNFTGQYNLIHAGSLIPIKNQRLLLESVALASQEIDGLQLHILGAGVLESELKTLAQKLGLDVVWHGQVEHHDLPLYYQRADLALLTSFFESQSMVALEAGACGIVTLGTEVGLLPELIDDQYLCQPTETNQLAQQIISFLTDMDLRTQLAGHVQQKINENYLLPHQIEHWLNLYNQVIRQNAGKGLELP